VEVNAMKIIPLSSTMLSIYSQQLSETLPDALQTTQPVPRPDKLSEIKAATTHVDCQR
jgi:hypothetical protein